MIARIVTKAINVPESFQARLEVFILEGDVIDTGEKVPLDFIQLPVSAFKHDLGNFEGFFDAVVCISCSSPPGKGGNEIALETGTEDIGINANYRAGIEVCIDGAF